MVERIASSLDQIHSKTEAVYCNHSDFADSRWMYGVRLMIEVVVGEVWSLHPDSQKGWTPSANNRSHCSVLATMYIDRTGETEEQNKTAFAPARNTAEFAAVVVRTFLQVESHTRCCTVEEEGEHRPVGALDLCLVRNFVHGEVEVALYSLTGLPKVDMDRSVVEEAQNEMLVAEARLRATAVDIELAVEVVQNATQGEEIREASPIEGAEQCRPAAEEYDHRKADIERQWENVEGRDIAHAAVRNVQDQAAGVDKMAQPTESARIRTVFASLHTTAAEHIEIQQKTVLSCVPEEVRTPRELE